MNILSIQSWVAYGHVGNAAAMFPLQRLGAEVWAVNTVQFSNHTGYGAWTGEVFTGAAIRALIDGIAARGALARCDAVLSGYMGDADIGLAVLDALARARAANPRALYCCDPVIGDDDTGVYVRPGIAELMRDRMLASADIATPNRFELEFLTGAACATLDDAKAGAVRLAATMRPDGPRIVLLTSLRTAETPAGACGYAGGRVRAVSPPAHAGAADQRQRRGRRAGRLVPVPSPFHRRRRGGVGAGRVIAVRRAPPDGRGGRARAVPRRRPGGVRGAGDAVCRRPLLSASRALPPSRHRGMG